MKLRFVVTDVNEEEYLVKDRLTGKSFKCKKNQINEIIWDLLCV